MQVGGGGAGRCCLRCILLGLAQLGYRGGEGDELGHQSYGRQRRVTSQVSGEGDRDSHCRSQAFNSTVR